MEEFNEPDQSTFNLPTILTRKDYEYNENTLRKINTKNLSIIHKKKIIAKLHSIILEEDAETLDLFPKEHNSNLELPNYLNPNSVSEILHYMYFREIKSLPFNEIFGLLDLAIFFKIKELTSKIIIFLRKCINNANKAVFIRFSLFYIKKRSDFHTADSLQEIISICEVFLLKNNHIQEFLSFYVHHYLALSQSLSDFETDLLNKLEMMKKCQIKGVYMLKFLSLFKDRLILLKKEKEE